MYTPISWMMTEKKRSTAGLSDENNKMRQNRDIIGWCKKILCDIIVLSLEMFGFHKTVYNKWMRLSENNCSFGGILC